MRFVTFSQGQAARLGLLAGTAVIDLHLADPTLSEGMRSFLEAGPEAMERAAAVLDGWAAGRLSPAAVYPLEGLALLPGDVILTGTPHGTGYFGRPPLYLQDGDVVEIEIEKVGLLRNPCRTVAGREK